MSEAAYTGISNELRESAERERRDARTRLREIEEEAKLLRLNLERLDNFLDGDISDPGRGLRGAKLGRKVREILLEKGEPMHYKDIYETVTADYVIGGRDPLALMLTSLSRDPYVRRLGKRTGIYEAIPVPEADGPARYDLWPVTGRFETEPKT